MHERTDLPGAQVSCKEQHTATSTTRSRIVFESVVNGDSASIFCRVAWTHAELSQMASEADKQLTNNACPIGLLHFRKRDLKIAHTHTSEATNQDVRSHSKTYPHRSRQMSGENSKYPNK